MRTTLAWTAVALTLSVVTVRAADQPTAKEVLAAAAKAAEDVTDLEERGRLLHSIGFQLALAGDAAAAKQVFTEVIALDRKLEAAESNSRLTFLPPALIEAKLVDEAIALLKELEKTLPAANVNLSKIACVEVLCGTGNLKLMLKLAEGLDSDAVRLALVTEHLAAKDIKEAERFTAKISNCDWLVRARCRLAVAHHLAGNTEKRNALLSEVKESILAEAKKFKDMPELARSITMAMRRYFAGALAEIGDRKAAGAVVAELDGNSLAAKTARDYARTDIFRFELAADDLTAAAKTAGEFELPKYIGQAHNRVAAYYVAKGELLNATYSVVKIEDPYHRSVGHLALAAGLAKAGKAADARTQLNIAVKYAGPTGEKLRWEDGEVYLPDAWPRVVIRRSVARVRVALGEAKEAFDAALAEKDPKERTQLLLALGVGFRPPFPGEHE